MFKLKCSLKNLSPLLNKTYQNQFKRFSTMQSDAPISQRFHEIYLKEMERMQANSYNFNKYIVNQL